MCMHGHVCVSLQLNPYAIWSAHIACLNTEGTNTEWQVDGSCALGGGGGGFVFPKGL